MHDSASIYMIPAMLRDTGLDREVLRLLKLEDRINLRHERKAWAKWCDFMDKIGNAKHEIDDRHHRQVHLRARQLRLDHQGPGARRHRPRLRRQAQVDRDHRRSPTRTSAKHLADVDGIIVPGGFGARGTEGKIACIRYARENNLPYLGLCFGFQMAVIEFARNVCGLKDANSTEIDPNTPEPVIDILPEQKKIEGLGGNMRLGGQDIEIQPQTLAWDLFGRTDTRPHAVPPPLRGGPALHRQPSRRTAWSSPARPPTSRSCRSWSCPTHPFFIGTQAHPCLTSRPLRPQPMFVGLVAAAMRRHHLDGDLPNCIEAVKKVCAAAEA